MTLTIDPHAAYTFTQKWANTTSEKRYANPFWTDFFQTLIGLNDLHIDGVEFEYPVKPANGNPLFIDVLYRNPDNGVSILIEHKSANANLDDAEVQGRNYIALLEPAQRPAILIVCDFKRFRIVDVIQNETFEFPLEELPNNIHRFEALLTQYTKDVVVTEKALNEHAVELLTNLYREFAAAGYEGENVSICLIRILFLLFGDDTRMWKKNQFAQLIENTSESGAGLGYLLQDLFYVMSLDDSERTGTLNSDLLAFPYLGGDLFEEPLPRVFNFNAEMRAALIEASNYDWADISPAIFGSMFQTIKSKAERRELGEHYTSEANILKVIRPLFLDDYLERLHKSWSNIRALKQLRHDLGSKRYLDPAAGSANFLTTAFKHLRDIETKIVARLQQLEGTTTSVGLSGTFVPSVQLEQFHAIEYEAWSSQIATVSLWIANHQSNLRIETLTGELPEHPLLSHSSTVLHSNALRSEWTDVCPIDDDTFIIGNPPFYGSRKLTSEQQADTQQIAGSINNYRSLDYVAMWFIKAARYMAGTKAKCAFVSTNSISHGVQPALLWGELNKHDMEIDFAHRSFTWGNEAGNNAAVSVVITAFSAKAAGKPAPQLWDYTKGKGEPALTKAMNINAYLLEAEDVLITSRSKPLVNGVQAMGQGSMAIDGQQLANITAEEADNIRATDPIAAKYLRPLATTDTFLKGKERYCLWLVDAELNELSSSPVIRSRMERTKAARLLLNSSFAVDGRDTPHLFGHISQPKTDYLVLPKTSTQNRDYVPVGFLSVNVITTNSLLTVPDATLLTFGIIQSRLFNVWTHAVSGRLNMALQISNTFVYNTFPFPQVESTEKNAVEAAAQSVLDARETHTTASLHNLYDPLVMPSNLRRAHKALDKAVLEAFGIPATATETEQLAFLFNCYAALVKEEAQGNN